MTWEAKRRIDVVGGEDEDVRDRPSDADAGLVFHGRTSSRSAIDGGLVPSSGIVAGAGVTFKMRGVVAGVLEETLG